MGGAVLRVDHAGVDFMGVPGDEGIVADLVNPAPEEVHVVRLGTSWTRGPRQSLPYCAARSRKVGLTIRSERSAVSDQLEHIHHQPGPMSPERMTAIRAAMEKREERAPKAGERAPDFALPLLHGDGRTVRLSTLHGRPVALTFGSYT